MLTEELVELIESGRKKNIKWRVEVSRDPRGRSEFVKVLPIYLGQKNSVMAEKKRWRRDLLRLEGELPQVVCGIYGPDVDIQMIDEDLLYFMEEFCEV
tara:strand:+ start:207 stop:500 length:294 start_codon:yes stop_codon:yes gene_type:complete